MCLQCGQPQDWDLSYLALLRLVGVADSQAHVSGKVSSLQLKTPETVQREKKRFKPLEVNIGVGFPIDIPLTSFRI